MVWLKTVSLSEKMLSGAIYLEYGGFGFIKVVYSRHVLLNLCTKPGKYAIM
jgi:hypothetical protein